MLAVGRSTVALPVVSGSSSPGRGECEWASSTTVNHYPGNAVKCSIDIHSCYSCNDGRVMAKQTSSHTSSSVAVESSTTFHTLLGKTRLALGSWRLGDWQKSSTLAIPAVQRHTDLPFISAISSTGVGNIIRRRFDKSGFHHGCHSQTRRGGIVMCHHPINSDLPCVAAISSTGTGNIGPEESSIHLAALAPQAPRSQSSQLFSSQSPVASLALGPPFEIYDGKDADFFQAGVGLHSEIRQKIESGVIFKENKEPPELKHMSNPKSLTKGSFLLRNGDGNEVHAMVEGAICVVRDEKSIGNSILMVWMGPSTDAPHIMFELVMAENRLFFLMDLRPRRDLVLHVDYLDEVYIKSGLEELRKRCDQDERMKKYHLTKLYAQHSFSPAYLAYTVPLSEYPINKDAEEEEEGVMAKALREVVRPIALEWLDIWLSLRQSRANNVTSSGDRESLAKRDFVLRAESIEREDGLERAFGVDLASKLKDAIKSL